MPDAHKGFFAGVLDRLPQLVGAGVSAVTLNLVCASSLSPGRRLPMSLFSPDPALSSGGAAEAALELKQV